MVTGIEATSGGIAANNSNLLAALAGIAESTKLRLTVVDYLERSTDRPDALPHDVGFLAARGSKIRFVGLLLRAVRPGDAVVVDHVGLATPLLPLAIFRWITLVILAHGSEASWRMTRWGRRCYRAADLVLANSELTVGRIRSAVPGVRATACLLGLNARVEVNRKCPAATTPDRQWRAADGQWRTLGARYLLLAGRMDASERRKGHWQMLSALRSLAGEYPEVQVVFAGPGDDHDNLEDAARRHGIGDRVFLTGELRRDEIDALYKGCFAYAMPSRQEGFGLAYLEAMNCCKACIGCRDDGAGEVIVDGETGILIDDPDDVAELAGALRILLEDPLGTEKLGAAGFRRLHERFLPDQGQERIRTAIEPLLA